MKKLFIGLFILCTYPCFSQATIQPHIFNDTSLYFIQQFKGGNPIELSADDLALAEQPLLQAFEEFNLAEQQYADSVNPKKKKRKAHAIKLDAGQYVYKLIPVKANGNEITIWILGNSKTWIKRKGYVTDKDWKQKFTDPGMALDGGTGYIHVLINLTNKSHGKLAINGMA